MFLPIVSSLCSALARVDSMIPTLCIRSTMATGAMCSFDQDDDVRKYVIARKFEKKGKTVTKRPHIQRLITPIRLQRKRARAAAKKISYAKAQRDASEYARYVIAICVCRVGGVLWQILVAEFRDVLLDDLVESAVHPKQAPFSACLPAVLFAHIWLLCRSLLWFDDRAKKRFQVRVAPERLTTPPGLPRFARPFLVSQPVRPAPEGAEGGPPLHDLQEAQLSQGLGQGRGVISTQPSVAMP